MARHSQSVPRVDCERRGGDIPVVAIGAEEFVAFAPGLGGPGVRGGGEVVEVVGGFPRGLEGGVGHGARHAEVQVVGGGDGGGDVV